MMARDKENNNINPSAEKSPEEGSAEATATLESATSKDKKELPASNSSNSSFNNKKQKMILLLGILVVVAALGLGVGLLMDNDTNTLEAETSNGKGEAKKRCEEEAETRCEEVVDPEFGIGDEALFEQPDGVETYRIWAEGGNVEKNARAYCIWSHFLQDVNIRIENYTIGCEGKPNTLYANQDEESEVSFCEVGSFEGRLSGNSSSACYNLFTMIECCWETDPCNNVCFPPDAAVNIQGKGSTAMKDLRVGDNVQVSSDGVFEPIYSIAHKSNDPANFLKIQTENGALEISKNHMLFIEGSSKPAVAKDVNVGDSLIRDGGPSEVKYIEKVKHQGFYAPLTYSGRIVVNGFETSVYARLFGETSWERLGLPFNMQGWYTMLQSPHRMLCKLKFDICRKETHNEEGFSNMLSFNYKLYGWWMKQNILVGLLTIPLIYIIFGCLFAVEFVIFDNLAASVALALAVLIWKYFSAVEIRAGSKKTHE